MLIDNQCSIYEHRPRTCRTYDCRVFPAAAVDPGPDKPLIAGQARRWRFDHPTPSDRTQHDAVRAAAVYLDEEAGLLPDGAAPTTATQRAVLAIEVHQAFLGRDEETGTAMLVDPDPDVVRAEWARRRGSPEPA